MTNCSLSNSGVTVNVIDRDALLKLNPILRKLSVLAKSFFDCKIIPSFEEDNPMHCCLWVLIDSVIAYGHLNTALLTGQPLLKVEDDFSQDACQRLEGTVKIIEAIQEVLDNNKKGDTETIAQLKQQLIHHGKPARGIRILFY